MVATRTKQQNSRFHGLLTLRKFDSEDKAELVRVVTGGRTTHSSEMSEAEMAEAISRLEDDAIASLKRMRAKIYNIARDIFELGPKDAFEQRHFDAVDSFSRHQYGKPLYKLSREQTRNLVTAMERWRDGEMDKFVKSLLTDS